MLVRTQSTRVNHKDEQKRVDLDSVSNPLLKSGYLLHYIFLLYMTVSVDVFLLLTVQ